MNQASSQKNIQTLQCGRGLAAMAVLQFHANLTLALPKYFNREAAHFFTSGFSGIYYFFVLSGAVMVLAHWDQIGNRWAPTSFYIKRFIRIYLPLGRRSFSSSRFLLAAPRRPKFCLHFLAFPRAPSRF